MGQKTNIDPLEVIRSNAFAAGKTAAQCRWKVQVLKEMFEAMSDQDPIRFDDHVSCFLGVMTICSEISDQLVEVESTFDIVKKHADFCSPDPEKLKAYEETIEEEDHDLL